MADKAISELVAAEQITASDMFVLEQNGTAKRLTGQVLLNWLTAAADGHGGVKSIEKLSTNKLADTYRITLADTTTFDFVVNNGKGITSIAKQSTSGLVDTYKISYNDGSSGTFTVTNGAKGDKGDNSYTWVKYASQQPTASSHSFGDNPDAWIGIYTGTSATAPTDWQQYKWYKIKGEQGNTGSPATLTSSQVTYQVGSSGTVIPSGNWSTSIPVVTPGQYLWTRNVIQFNTGSAITSYSVSRFGIDGSGAVSAVAGIAPDENGNVPLTADNLGALSKKGGTMEGSINMNGQKLYGLNAPTSSNEAANKEYVDQSKKGFATEEFVNNALANFSGGMSAQLLWQNDSPSSEFAARTIPIDLNEYDFVIVETGHGTGFFRIGAAIQMFAMVDSKMVRRIFVANKSGIEVTNATNESNATVNNVAIPSLIYGVKGVS